MQPASYVARLHYGDDLHDKQTSAQGAIRSSDADLAHRIQSSTVICRKKSVRTAREYIRDLVTP